MNIINLTPHDIVVVVTDNGNVTFPKTGKVARVVSSSKFVKFINEIPVMQTTFGNAIELPDPQDDTYYIVSSVVLDNINRNDLICPDTGPDSVVRDNNGNIIGVKRFRVKYYD